MVSSKPSTRVLGIDVGGTNIDIVYLQDDKVLAWHKTPTTPDIQTGVENAIEAIVRKAEILLGHVDSVKIGTTVSESEFSPYSQAEMA
jgi:N-methylhydantoinase A/oxoprolinase/acetone carboxylase beta subunit